MNKIIIAGITAVAVATSSFAKTPVPMSDKEIDKVLLSFTKEREAEKKKEEEAKLNGGAPYKLPEAKSAQSPGSIQVYPADPNNPKVYGDKENKAATLPLEMNYNGGSFKIQGISCENNRCVIFTSEGIKKVGDMIGGVEKITGIGTRGITTTLRKVDF